MNRTIAMLAVALLAGLTTLPTGQSIRTDPDLFVDKACDAANRALAGDVCLGDVYEPCPEGQTGIYVGTAFTCRTLPGPFEPCPAGQVGVTSGGAKGCQDVPELPCLKCESDPGSEGGGDPECTLREDDGGFAGTRVTCYYDCFGYEVLHISVTADDPDADVAGYTDCGGAHANCPRTPVHCQGVSDELTERRDSRGCVGQSYEFWSSAVTVTCAAVGLGLPCMIVDCDLSSSSFQASCIAQNPDVSQETMSRLLSTLPLEPVSSFAIAEFSGMGETVQGWAVVYNAQDAVCSAGPL